MYVCMYVFQVYSPATNTLCTFTKLDIPPTPTLKTLLIARTDQFLSGILIRTVLYPLQETPECQPAHQHQEVQGSVGHHAQQQVVGWGPARVQKQRQWKKGQSEKLQRQWWMDTDPLL